MKELSRHIEILLLNNDCVIVPGFGGFVAHHRTAEYVTEEEAFFPPQRTLGFNPQLQLNDSLLVQSYVEAYDISYPEALHRIESEVEEIKQKINVDGSYEFHGIGVVNKNSDGHYSFEPCMAGLLTPSLYALDSYIIGSVEKVKALTDTPETLTDVSEEVALEDSPLIEEYADNTEVTDSEDYCVDDEEEEDEATISIRIDTLKYIAAAAVLLFLFVMACLPLGKGSDNVAGGSTASKHSATLQCSMVDTDFIGRLMRFNADVKEQNQAVDSAKTKKESENVVEAAKETTADNVASKEETLPYHIVMASKVSKKGAQEYVAILKKAGYDDASVYEHGSMRRVVYGAYKTEKEAAVQLHELRKKDHRFDSTWVQKLK